MDKKALLVISFGTSFAETREKTITATENTLANAFPTYDLRRAFTSHRVIRKVNQLDGLIVDTVTQAIERLSAEGYQEVLIQPLHVINGTEYHQLLMELKPYAQRFAKFAVGCPLLTSYQDYVAVVDALREILPASTPGEAVVMMGHGSRHPANSAYSQLDYAFKDAGFPHVYIGTVEGYPTLGVVIRRLVADSIKKVTLFPFMLVAGDHAQNDMAGDDENSWKIILKRRGFIVETRMMGLGEIEKIRRIYVDHARAALENEAE